MKAQALRMNFPFNETRGGDKAPALWRPFWPPCSCVWNRRRVSLQPTSFRCVRAAVVSGSDWWVIGV